MFVNLLSNALDASKEQDEVTITAHSKDKSIEISIEDQGHGIPATNLSRIFEPFYTTKEPDQGTGLGLAIVSTIVEEHHGSIAAEPVSNNGGTRVILHLPEYSHDLHLTSPDKTVISSKYQEDEL